VPPVKIPKRKEESRARTPEPSVDRAPPENPRKKEEEKPSAFARPLSPPEEQQTEMTEVMEEKKKEVRFASLEESKLPKVDTAPEQPPSESL